MLEQRISEYIGGLLSPHDDEVLLEMEQEAQRRGFPIVGRTCGVTCELFARAISAKRVFELGSGFGYSARFFATAVGPDGEVHCTDGDPDNAAAAEKYLTQAGLWDRITFHVGDALSAASKVTGEFDIVYCDVDKHGYPECWETMSKRIKIGGLWICDNALWSGEVIEPGTDKNSLAIATHNQAISNDPNFVSVIIPSRDGLMVALRIS